MATSGGSWPSKMLLITCRAYQGLCSNYTQIGCAQSSNGIRPNGLRSNGLRSNGLRSNGLRSNGLRSGNNELPHLPIHTTERDHHLFQLTEQNETTTCFNSQNTTRPPLLLFKREEQVLVELDEIQGFLKKDIYDLLQETFIFRKRINNSCHMAPLKEQRGSTPSQTLTQRGSTPSQTLTQKPFSACLLLDLRTQNAQLRVARNEEPRSGSYSKSKSPLHLPTQRVRGHYHLPMPLV
jgi:hypothetical protein